MAKPWERQPNETSLKYSYFCVYRDMKDPRDPTSKRTIEKTGEKVGKKASYLEAISAEQNWVDRATAWDEDQERKIRADEEKQRIADIRKMRKRHAAAGKYASVKALKAIAKLAEEDINAAAAIKMLVDGIKVEKEAMGDASEVVEFRDGGDAMPAVTFYIPNNNRDGNGEDDDIDTDDTLDMDGEDDADD